MAHHVGLVGLLARRADGGKVVHHTSAIGRKCEGGAHRSAGRHDLGPGDRAGHRVVGAVTLVQTLERGAVRQLVRNSDDLGVLGLVAIVDGVGDVRRLLAADGRRRIRARGHSAHGGHDHHLIHARASLVQRVLLVEVIGELLLATATSRVVQGRLLPALVVFLARLLEDGRLDGLAHHVGVSILAGLGIAHGDGEVVAQLDQVFLIDAQTIAGQVLDRGHAVVFQLAVGVINIRAHIAEQVFARRCRITGVGGRELIAGIQFPLVAGNLVAIHDGLVVPLLQGNLHAADASLFGLLHAIVETIATGGAGVVPDGVAQISLRAVNVAQRQAVLLLVAAPCGGRILVDGHAVLIGGNLGGKGPGAGGTGDVAQVVVAYELIGLARVGEAFAPVLGRVLGPGGQRRLQQTGRHHVHRLDDVGLARLQTEAEGTIVTGDGGGQRLVGIAGQVVGDGVGLGIVLVHRDAHAVQTPLLDRLGALHLLLGGELVARADALGVEQRVDELAILERAVLVHVVAIGNAGVHDRRRNT